MIQTPYRNVPRRELAVDVIFGACIVLGVVLAILSVVAAVIEGLGLPWHA